MKIGFNNHNNNNEEENMKNRSVSKRKGVVLAAFAICVIFVAGAVGMVSADDAGRKLFEDQMKYQGGGGSSSSSSTYYVHTKCYNNWGPKGGIYFCCNTYDSRSRCERNGMSCTTVSESTLNAEREKAKGNGVLPACVPY